MKDETKLVGVVVYCDVLKKEVTIEEKFINFSAISQECDMCGSHGNISLYVNKCECGGYHDIDVYTW